jgi:hypothetical protein
MWKHSRLRFYILNSLWNYRFWLFSKKIFKNHTFFVEDRDLKLEDVDITGKIRFNKKQISRRRFVGYMYKGMMYLDNPGFKHTVDKESWEAWKKKGLIK